MLNKIIASRPSDHYFRSDCLSICLFVCAEFFSTVFDPTSIKLGHRRFQKCLYAIFDHFDILHTWKNESQRYLKMQGPWQFLHNKGSCCPLKSGTGAKNEAVI